METQKRNLILVTMDEVRPDKLSCYGNKRIQTENIDRLASMGALFETCIAVSSLTPVCHASLLTGVNPTIHGLRNPYCRINFPTLARIFKENGYNTAGFVGVTLLGPALGFSDGFDYYDYPQEGWHRTIYDKKDEPITQNHPLIEVVLGNFYQDRLWEWLRKHRETPFFLWTHYFDCHQAAEKVLLKMGKIREGVMPEYGYYDPKVKYMDKVHFGTMLDLLEEIGIMEKTNFIITSDHGTNLEEHEVPPFPHLDLIYPQHTTQYDHDLKVPLIIVAPKIPLGKRVKGQVRHIDIVPTVVELMRFKTSIKFDGISLMPAIMEGQMTGSIAYGEELFHLRGPGDFQSMRSDNLKFIIDRRSGKEEAYDLIADPAEKKNIINTLAAEQQSQIQEWRKFMDEAYQGLQKATEITGKDRLQVEERLKMLGYIE
jgi:arylsulfatase A-like enzyme